MSGTYQIWPPPVSGGTAGGSGVTSVGSTDQQAPAVFGATIIGTVIYMQSASSTSPGLVNNTSQVFSGVKTFSSTPIISSLISSGPLFTNNAGLLTSGSVSLTNQVSGILPQANLTLTPTFTLATIGSVTQTSSAGGTLMTMTWPGGYGFAGQTNVIASAGFMSWGGLNLMTGSVSLAAQVSGILPQANLTLLPTFTKATLGSVSYTSSAGGAAITLSMAGNYGNPGQTAVVSSAGFIGWGGLNVMSGSVSLTNQVSGILPQANLTLTPTFTQSTLGSVTHTSSAGGVAYSLSYPGIPGPAGTVLTVSSGGSALYWGATSAALKAPTIQTFSSGSANYTTPTSPAPLYLRVLVVGGGGSGAGASAGSPTSGTAGANTTFGSTSFLLANGGAAGGVGGGAGGSATIGSGSFGQTYSGSDGSSSISLAALSVAGPGANGGSSYLGGSGGGATPGNAGNNGKPNTGSGGGGGGSSISTIAGSGGGSGGYIDALIYSPAASYGYSVGNGGVGGNGTASTGGSGGNGIIFVYEYYQ